ncbi:hypothetical protein I7I50_10897 [Histoplasma capsulatum G186AR]|uniref:Uncharacterized protein n=1 Tax=Ajellomyces capsulatus TaxID=5037 RepID=A0A8H7Z877_AJECA|nr:hypothetical protein I7I52_02135 [Histoplasma capsulatum]QSS69567.1 hypothetical protein I7I50_10897 [Histoplasma capsulatum G186AR]
MKVPSTIDLSIFKLFYLFRCYNAVEDLRCNGSRWDGKQGMESLCRVNERGLYAVRMASTREEVRVIWRVQIAGDGTAAPKMPGWLAGKRRNGMVCLGRKEGRLGAEGLGERRRERTRRELEVGGLAVLARPLCGGEARAGPAKFSRGKGKGGERGLTNGR